MKFFTTTLALIATGTYASTSGGLATEDNDLRSLVEALTAPLAAKVDEQSNKIDEQSNKIDQQSKEIAYLKNKILQDKKKKLRGLKKTEEEEIDQDIEQAFYFDKFKELDEAVATIQGCLQFNTADGGTCTVGENAASVTVFTDNIHPNGDGPINVSGSGLTATTLKATGILESGVGLVGASSTPALVLTGNLQVNGAIHSSGAITSDTAVKTDTISSVTTGVAVSVTGSKGLKANKLTADDVVANTAVKTLTISPTGTNMGPVQVTGDGLTASTLTANSKVVTDTIDPNAGMGPVNVNGDGLTAGTLTATSKVKTDTISSETSGEPVTVSGSKGLVAKKLTATDGGVITDDIHPLTSGDPVEVSGSEGLLAETVNATTLLVTEDFQVDGDLKVNALEADSLLINPTP